MSELLVNPPQSAEEFMGGKGEILITPTGAVRMPEETVEETTVQEEVQTPIVGEEEKQAEQVVVVEPEQQSTPAFDFSRFGVQSEEELSARLAHLSQLEGRAKEFDAFNEIKSKINAPYADESIARVNAVVRETGIKNLSIASDIATLTAEQLRADPAKALAFREILNNPDLINAVSFSEIRQAMADQYKIEEGEDITPLAKIQIETAIKEVQKKVDSIQTGGNDIISTLLKEREQSVYLQNQKSEKAAQDVETAVSKFSTLKAKFGGEEISVAVSPELLGQVKGWATQFAANLPESESYHSSIDTYITATLKSALEDKIAEKFRERIEGKIKQEAIKDTHNGGSVTHKDKPDADSGTWIPEWQQAHLDYIKKSGGQVPTGK